MIGVVATLKIKEGSGADFELSLIHISEPTRPEKMTQLMFFLKDIKIKKHKMLTGKLIISESLVQKWVLSWQGRQK